jgi:hypothetical protein
LIQLPGEQNCNAGHPQNESGLYKVCPTAEHRFQEQQRLGVTKPSTYDSVNTVLACARLDAGPSCCNSLRHHCVDSEVVSSGPFRLTRDHRDPLQAVSTHVRKRADLRGGRYGCHHALDYASVPSHCLSLGHLFVDDRHHCVDCKQFHHAPFEALAPLYLARFGRLCLLWRSRRPYCDVYLWHCKLRFFLRLLCRDREVLDQESCQEQGTFQRRVGNSTITELCDDLFGYVRKVLFGFYFVVIGSGIIAIGYLGNSLLKVAIQFLGLVTAAHIAKVIDIVLLVLLLVDCDSCLGLHRAVIGRGSLLHCLCVRQECIWSPSSRVLSRLSSRFFFPHSPLLCVVLSSSVFRLASRQAPPDLSQNGGGS